MGTERMNHQEDSANVVLRYTEGSISRREFVRRATLLGLSMPAMVALIEACGTSSAISEMPASNQDLRIGFVKDEYVTTGPGGAVGQYPLNAGVYEPLVRLNPDYTYSPLLAKSFEQTGNNTFRFHLRPGVMWHDGSPLTADDVKFTLDRQGQAGSGPTGLGPNSTKVVDDQTVDVALTQANNRFVESLVHPVYGILKKGSQPGPTAPAGARGEQTEPADRSIPSKKTFARCQFALF